MTLRIGSLFSGYGGLDLGVQAVLGGKIAWHCQYDPEDKFQYAARILAHHWPGVPNLGEISAVNWQCVLDELGPIDVVLGGFPCTDLSSAGQRLGLMIGTRSGLWHYMLRAIAVLRPRLVVIENVRGILSTKARSGVEPCPCCVEYAGSKPLLRALGAVLGDLAAVGFDAEWAGVRASEIGAPHERFREFVLAWPADASGPGLEGQRILGAVAEHAAAAADTTHVGHERRGETRNGRTGLADGGRSAADTDGERLSTYGEPPAGRFGVRQQAGNDLDGRNSTAPYAESVGRGEGRTESAGQFGRPDAAERGSEAAASAYHVGRGQGERQLQPRHPDIEWGGYEPAIRRWEAILGRPHPRPTDDRGRLAAEFSEWMQGLAAGHVCSVPAAPGMSEAALRNARLKALGNGVVPLQAEAALRLLLARVLPEVPLLLGDEEAA
ncbi:DNA cytosine methyltransferase [Streptomyces sp. NBC_01456]|uniref:DNA cytosine methyltransferase n=1 Tax=unclassified Streptomyces TaxID=2593676 RepID=UPI002E36642A|nr:MULTISPECIES: DNA cytosine methyltransferase [unclassified Streptomyces]